MDDMDLMTSEALKSPHITETAGEADLCVSWSNAIGSTQHHPSGTLSVPHTLT